MKYYLKLYKALFLINLKNLLVYRVNFYNSLFSSIAWGLFSIFSMLILTSKTTQIFGWTREEILLLTGGYSVCIGIFHFLFSRNFEKISEIVHRGHFDLILTKPVDAQFLSTTRFINYTSLFRIFAGLFFIIYILKEFAIIITLNQIVGASILLLFGLAIIYDVWLLFITLTIWFTRLSNLPDFMYSFTSIGRFPGEIYKETLGFLFLFLLPLTLVVTIPVKALIGRVVAGDVALIILISFVLTFLARRFWLFALKFYTSAGG